MDLNQLLYDHELAKLHAKRAILPVDRNTSSELADHYASQIAAYRKSHGLPDTRWPQG